MPPDEIATPDDLIESSEAAATEAVDPAQAENDAVDAAIAAAAAIDGVKPSEEGEEPAADAEPEPAAEPEAEVEPEAEPEPEALSDEQQDEADAKSLGFKNMKATAEFKAMRAELRELRPLREQMESFEKPAKQWSELTGYFEQQHITPDQFGQAMNLLSAYNSTDLAVKRQARDVLANELKVLNAQIGEEGGGYDPLSEPANRDLADAVEEQDLSRDRALEIARLRHESQHTQTVSQRQAEQRTQQQAAYAARAELDAVGEEYRAVDAGYMQKVEILKPILRTIFADLPPNLWASKFKEAYAAIGQVPASAPARPAARPAPLRNQPLRPSPTNGAMQQAEIKTEEQAIEAALRRAAERDGVAY